MTEVTVCLTRAGPWGLPSPLVPLTPDECLRVTAQVAFWSPDQAREKGRCLSTARRSAAGWAVPACVSLTLCFFSLTMHALVPSNPYQPVCHLAGFLEAVALGRGCGSCPQGGFVGPEGVCIPPLSVGSHRASPSLGRQPSLGRWEVRPVSGLGHSVQGAGLSPASPPWSQAPQEDTKWKLARPAFWYLKRGFPLYVRFINGEYTGETLICVSNSEREGARTHTRLRDRDAVVSHCQVCLGFPGPRHGCYL